MNTFGDKPDIYYPEFLFHMKHLGYFSPTMSSYMVSLKYDFEEFWSKHWLYASTFANIYADIQVISHVDSKLQLLMKKLVGVLLIDSTKATPSGKMSNTLYIIF